jgi:hypothetical protein
MKRRRHRGECEFLKMPCRVSTQSVAICGGTLYRARGRYSASKHNNRMPPGKRRKEEAAVHRPSITPSEFALFCWLRRNPKVAATYGIEKCDGETTIGSMLLQTLDSQGMDVKWHLQVPNGAITDESTSNEKGAALIKSVSRRPGARMKQLSQRPCVAPPSNAAVLRNGVLPRVSFPLLAELSKDRQKRSTTARGNRIGPPNDVAFMQRRQLVDFVEKKLRCERHSKRLRFCATKSHQVGVCASWFAALSRPLHGLRLYPALYVSVSLATCTCTCVGLSCVASARRGVGCPTGGKITYLHCGSICTS